VHEKTLNAKQKRRLAQLKVPSSLITIDYESLYRYLDIYEYIHIIVLIL